MGNDYEWSEYSKNKAAEKQQKKKEKKKNKNKEIGEMNMSEEMNQDERTVKRSHWKLGCVFVGVLLHYRTYNTQNVTCNSTCRLCRC